tara:strand:- start:806 stop:1195 length:390 start_codon:yes stop_codon:yes gene_type:complete
MAQGRRVEKFSALIKREISQILLLGIRDARVHQAMVTITGVEVSGDLQHCKIYVSVFGDQNQKNVVIEGLIASIGFLRGELARNLQMRRAPELSFYLDKAIEKGTSVLNLLDKLEEERKSHLETNEDIK